MPLGRPMRGLEGSERVLREFGDHKGSGREHLRDEVALFASAARVTQIRQFEAFRTRASSFERRVQLFGSPRTGSVQKAQSHTCIRPRRAAQRSHSLTDSLTD
jgi:hypothetical protein